MYGVKQLDRPKSLEQALELLSDNSEIMPFAGGTDILVKMRAQNMQGVHLMSLQDLKELSFIKEMDDGIHIGPMITYAKLAANPLIEKYLPLLKTAALAMGGPQVQNLATIGGNICNGATSADGAAPLMALDTQLVLRSNQGERTVPITEFYTGPGRVVLEPNELLIDIIIPSLPERGFAGVYKKFSTRKAMDIATLGSAATITLNSDGSIAKATLAYCTAGPTPVRCPMAEERLIGESELTDDLLDEVADLAVESANPRTSWRASKEYRINLIRQLAKKVLVESFNEARSSL
ncbi:MAG: xanthine dehydrogenase FAD-binding subunit XdhB [Fastidiosipila sp.]|nr:xanthine dehydrogenase FAD-binding subunit XdhB [Fastidiosipila sp.]